MEAVKGKWPYQKRSEYEATNTLTTLESSFWKPHLKLRLFVICGQ